MPSSVIRSWHYDPPARQLEICFVTGRRYRYNGVPAAVVEGLETAASRGRYFNARIRDSFHATRIRG